MPTAKSTKSAKPAVAVVSFRAFIRQGEKGGMNYLEVPKTVVAKLGGKHGMRLVCEVERGALEFPCALMAIGRSSAIFISQEKLRKLERRPGERVAVALKPDRSKYGMPVPPELKAAFREDPEGLKLFDALKPGKQRNIIWFIASIRDEDTRVDRAVHVLRGLRRLDPKDPKAFYALFKMPKRRPDELVAEEPVRARDDDDFMSRIFPAGSQD